MKKFDPIAYKKMVKYYQDKDEPTAWFDTVYTDAQGDHTAVFWADLEPSPHLLKWLKNERLTSVPQKAIVIGCGVGDDAEALRKSGYQVTAFDISPEAIRLCKNRYPASTVNYLVADLFDYPIQWAASYDLVYECNTIQVLPGKYRLKARDAMVSLLVTQGHILVSCRSRLEGHQQDDIPLPLDKNEIDGFIRCGLTEDSFEVYNDSQQPPVAHFFACYTK